MKTDFLFEHCKVVLAVSGGVDSMVMLHRFLSLSVPMELQVVTVQHGLRKEAQAEAAGVRAYCEAHGVPFVSETVDVPEYCRRNKVSVETGARQLRYEVLLRYASRADFLCLAHQAEDNAETVLMHLVRGSGLSGVCGMAEHCGKIVRPMLGETREEILRYAAEHRIPYWEDASNADVRYTRNYFRHEVLPVLQKVNPRATEAICRFSAVAAEDEALLQSLVKEEWIGAGTGGSVTLAKEAFNALPLARRAILRVLRSFGVWQNVEAKHLQGVCDLFLHKQNAKIYELPFDIRVMRDYNQLIFYKGSETLSDAEEPFREGKTRFDGQTIWVTRSGCGLRFDPTKLPQGCVFRHRREGDRFCKFGGGTKSLGDFLTDRKISHAVRDKLIVVAKGSDVYVVIGVEIADSVKAEHNANERFIYMGEEG